MWEVVDMMRAEGLARSDREVSATWLRRAPNYLADRNGQLTAATAIGLYVRLHEHGHAALAEQVWKRVLLPLGRQASGTGTDDTICQPRNLNEHRDMKA